MQEISSVTFTPSHEVLYQPQKLRLGVVGKPSDWLIASSVDYAAVLEKMNIEMAMESLYMSKSSFFRLKRAAFADLYERVNNDESLKDV